MESTSINHFFDQVYVITPENDNDRQETAAKNLCDIDYTLFYAVDRKTLVLDDLIFDGFYDEEKAIDLHRYNKPMNTGQIGSSWTHRKVYEDIIAKKYKRVLILEDDVTPVKEGVELLLSKLELLPGNWELLYLDCDVNLKRNLGSRFKQAVMHLKRLIGKLKWNHTMIKNLHARKHSENLLIAGRHGCTNAYAITQSAAVKLVKLQTPITFPANDLLAYACTNKLVTGYVLTPSAFKRDLRINVKSLIG